jgi:hypothetical protein
MEKIKPENKQKSKNIIRLSKNKKFTINILENDNIIIDNKLKLKDFVSMSRIKYSSPSFSISKNNYNTSSVYLNTLPEIEPNIFKKKVINNINNKNDNSVQFSSSSNNKPLKYLNCLKYFFNKEETMFEKTKKIKNLVKENLSMNRDIDNKERETVTEKEDDVNYKHYLRKEQNKSDFMANKLYNPYSEMSFMKRVIELKKEEPYLFLNKFHKTGVTKHNNILLNLFDRNNSHIKKC